VPNDAMIRDYLLGRMDWDATLVERIDDLMLSNPEFSENIDVIEDEIIEEYIEGTMSPADKKAVDSYFLRPPERQLKLRQARQLSRCFSSAPRKPMEQVQKPTREPLVPVSVLSQPRLQFPTYVAIAAVALLLYVAAYLFQSRRQLQAEIRTSDQKLVQEQERSSSLSQQLQSARAFAQPATVMLSLVQPGLRRADEPLPALSIGSGTNNIHVEIALPPPARGGEHDVRLETSGKAAWHPDKIQALSSSAGVILMFEVPAQVLAPGESRFVVSQKGEFETSYWFTTSKE